MKYISRILWALVCLLPVSWYFYLYFIWTDPGAGSWDGIIMIGGYISRITFFLTAIVVTIGIVISISTSKKFYALMPLFPLLTLVTVYVDSRIEKKHLAELEEERRVINEGIREWSKYDEILIPHIIDYVRMHPERITFPYDDDRTEIDGLVDYLRMKVPNMSYSEGSIKDPWGHNVSVIMDRENDMMLKYEDDSYGVYHRHGNQLVIALYSPSFLPYERGTSLCWQLEGGRVPNDPNTPKPPELDKG